MEHDRGDIQGRLGGMMSKSLKSFGLTERIHRFGKN